MNLPVAVGGKGIYLFDRDGRSYIDASGGAAVSCLGHSDRAVLEAIRRQLERMPFAHTSFFTNEPMEALADALTERAPATLDKVYFVSGGSEAIEAALKLARQYFVEKGEPQRRHLIARRQSYHGNTLGALAVGGNAWRRAQFKPLLIDVTHVSPCYEYRDRRADETPEQYGQRLVAELAETIERLGGENVIAFVAETVGGATAGVLTPVPGYFQGVRELCDRQLDRAFVERQGIFRYDFIRRILDLDAKIFGGLLLGKGEGFTLSDGTKISALEVETIQTIEAGYKGILGGRKLYLDVNGYYNFSENFLCLPPKSRKSIQKN